MNPERIWVRGEKVARADDGIACVIDGGLDECVVVRKVHRQSSVMVSSERSADDKDLCICCTRCCERRHLIAIRNSVGLHPERTDRPRKTPRIAGFDVLELHARVGCAEKFERSIASLHRGTISSPDKRNVIAGGAAAATGGMKNADAYDITFDRREQWFDVSIGEKSTRARSVLFDGRKRCSDFGGHFGSK